ncbi:VOC family protein [Saxibacter everestensis]|uniref:VOC family protein n=1 Tax=Saxibacter everestensis TaxID=2909229 RepID=A0ABY8QZR3_9MICO|nr:VOC family protein [Brevibacteriaceae bacterium ZFBP1038]
MLNHVGIQVGDVEASLQFYLRVFGPIGMREAVRIPLDAAPVIGLSGPDGVPDFWLSQADGVETRELHLAFAATDREAVDAVYEAARDGGAEVLHSPREWPEYHPGYYAVFLRDPDSHNVEAVFHGG